MDTLPDMSFVKQLIFFILAATLMAAPATAAQHGPPGTAQPGPSSGEDRRQQPAGKIVIKGKGGTVTDVRQGPPPRPRQEGDKK